MNAGNPREWGDLDSFLEEVASDGMRFEGDFDAYDARQSQHCFNKGAAPVFFSVVTRMGWPGEDAVLMRRLV